MRQGFSGLSDIYNHGKPLCGGNDFIHRVRIGGIARDAQSLESPHGIEAVQALGKENEVRMQGGNLLKIGVNSATYLGLFLCIRGIVAVDRVADEPVLDSEG